MATFWTLSSDADDPQRIAAFWALALGYIKEPGFDEPDNASITDPDGRGPAIGFLKVPEGKPDELRTVHFAPQSSLPSGSASPQSRARLAAGRPVVSTMMWRSRPLIFLPAS